MNLKSLQFMSKECKHLNLGEVAYYGGISSFIYSIKTGQITLEKLFHSKIDFLLISPKELSVMLRTFLFEVIYGFDEYDKRVRLIDDPIRESFYVRYPLFYISIVLSHLSQSSVALKIIRLINHDLSIIQWLR